jgi:hypothetical protein
MAPVSMVSNVKSGTQITFGNGRAPGCMRMRIQYRAAQLVVASSAAPAPFTGKVSILFSGANRAFTIPFTPANSFHFPSYIYNLSRLFNTFYIDRVVIHFEPRQSSSSNFTFVAASVQDPEWFETHNLLSAGIAVPTETSLVSRSNACSSNGWTPCTVNVPVDSKQKYFIASSNLNSAIDFSTENPATIRQAIPAIFAVASDISAVSATDIIIGDLYASLDIEYCDFSMVISVPVTLKEERKEKRSSSVKSLRSRGDSEDEYFK